MPDQTQLLTRAELGKEIGLVAHDLHNILPVLFGVVEELQSDTSDLAVRNAPLLQASVDKTEELARNLFVLRQRAAAED